MPARREYTEAEWRDALERQRTLRNARQQRWRLQHKAVASTVTSTPPPSTHVRTSRSPGNEVSTSTTNPLAAAPKPNKSADVIDALRAAGLPDVLTKADHQAVKASPLSPAQLVEAFGAAFRGEWGGEWLRDNLSLQAVVKRYPGYLAWKQRPKGATRTGMMLNGTYAPPAAFQTNRERSFKAADDYSEAQLAASDAERERVMAALPARLRGRSKWRAG